MCAIINMINYGIKKASLRRRFCFGDGGHVAREFAKKFYMSPLWERTRRLYLLSRHGLCERCGNAGKIVHHQIELTPANIQQIDTTCGWDNLELLCQDCHAAAHGLSATADGLLFNEDGDLVASPPG